MNFELSVWVWTGSSGHTTTPNVVLDSETPTSVPIPDPIAPIAQVGIG